MMIRDIFEKILFMGSQAVPVIVIVFALRILLHRFPKKYLYFLWLLVAVRLVLPVSISSDEYVSFAGVDSGVGAVNSCCGERTVVGGISRQDDHKRKADIGK